MPLSLNPTSSSSSDLGSEPTTSSSSSPWFNCASFFLLHLFSHPFFICQSRDKRVELKRFLDPLGFPPPFQHRPSSSQGHSGYKSFRSGMLVSPGTRNLARNAGSDQNSPAFGAKRNRGVLCNRLSTGMENSGHSGRNRTEFKILLNSPNFIQYICNCTYSTNSRVASGIVPMRPTTITTETRLIEITVLLSFVSFFFS